MCVYCDLYFYLRQHRISQRIISYHILAGNQNFELYVRLLAINLSSLICIGTKLLIFTGSILMCTFHLVYGVFAVEQETTWEKPDCLKEPAEVCRC